MLDEENLAECPRAIALFAHPAAEYDNLSGEAKSQL
jgi:hypothetical protein